MENLGIAGVGAITLLCYLIAQGIKATPLNLKWLPVICGVSGAVLGVVAMYVMPDFPATDIITALAVGAASGFAATGVNQAYKQLKTDEGEDA
jgi:ribonucleotide monophosphatase NagD (HAD superfamily)